MTTLNYGALAISAVLLCGGNAVGWVLTGDLAGTEASGSFLLFAGWPTSFIYILQVFLFFKSRNSLYFKLLFLTLFGLSLLWFLLCLFLPIFWMNNVNLTVKGLILLTAFALFFANSLKGVNDFNSQWRDGIPVVKKFYNSRAQALDWDALVKSLHLSHTIFIPGAPKWLDSLLPALLVVFMIVGMNFRKMYPVFSIFAWGVPCLVASSTLIQIIAMRFAQALKVVELEKQMGAIIRAKCD